MAVHHLIQTLVVVRVALVEWGQWEEGRSKEWGQEEWASKEWVAHREWGHPVWVLREWVDHRVWDHLAWGLQEWGHRIWEDQVEEWGQWVEWGKVLRIWVHLE
jgi:hypothetical protein